MEITQLTDYALRVLMYTGARDDRRVTLREIAAAYDISREHLRKVVHRLAALGHLETTRGRGGGVRLAVAPERIRIGDVVGRFERTMEIVDCQRQPCPLAGACALKDALDSAGDAFVARLNEYTLADLLGRRATTVRIMRLPRGHARTGDSRA